MPVEIPIHFSHLWGTRASLAPTTPSRFGFADACSATVVGEYADVTARRSVTHLTLPYNMFR
ncbi:MAG: hypothetical protein LBQ66_06080 [Planctomycetaceae bacterium]|nr:hypothetical protein [Planctomycetaceae bacterium]